jgi:hypothetical protein
VNGGVWRWRWFDQVTFPAALSIFTTFDKMYYVRRTRYIHYGSESDYRRAVMKNGKVVHEDVSWPKENRIVIREGKYPDENAISDQGNPE